MSQTMEEHLAEHMTEAHKDFVLEKLELVEAGTITMREFQRLLIEEGVGPKNPPTLDPPTEAT